MASQRAIETGTPNPTSVQPEHLDPSLQHFQMGRGGRRKPLPTSLTVPASLRGAGEGGREIRVAPGSWKCLPGCKPSWWEGGGNSSNSCISANCCCCRRCCIYCWRLSGEYSNDCRERTAAAAAGSLDQEIRAGAEDWRRRLRASQPAAAPGPREPPADARSSWAPGAVRVAATATVTHTRTLTLAHTLTHPRGRHLAALSL